MTALRLLGVSLRIVKDHGHASDLESFLSLLKRSIRGTYIPVQPFPLFPYLDEQAFRFNKTLRLGFHSVSGGHSVGRRQAADVQGRDRQQRHASRRTVKSAED